MSRTLGRRDSDDSATPDAPTGHLGAYRARDGSPGARVRIDLNRPHAGLVVGKRGYGKSYTLGVLAEELTRASGVLPVVADPMGVFSSLAGVGVEVVSCPRVPADALGPRAWCDLLGLAPDSAVGALVWQAAGACATLAGMREFVAAADTKAERATRRAAENHLALADSWDAFAPEGLAASDLLGDGSPSRSDAESNSGAGVVLDLSGFDPTPANAVVRGVASGLYDRCVRGTPARLPWLLVDEAHAFFTGTADPALRTVLTRGRQPGVSLVAATQRPSALPPVAISQADLVVAHRLTSHADLGALADARPTYVSSSFDERLPENPGEALVVDDATESVHAVRIRERGTPHGGGSPCASDLG
ncbi:ATP-binding protein [Halorussus amylolyticus]|uniref:ATP-binding protein n=1 Tax=Halorussus amylolyticus TaxID=1126242 RepID=UPI0010525860|nr:DUF87 domain-containing protein [Halorussus amylolyticus]